MVGYPLVSVFLLLFYDQVLCQREQQRIFALNDDSHAVTVKFEPLGPNNADLNETVTHGLRSPLVRELLDGTNHRLLHSRLYSAPPEQQEHLQPWARRKKTTGSADEDTYYQATIYDYSQGRTILVNGVPFGNPNAVTATEVNMQPLFNVDELAEAASMVGVESDEVVTNGMPPVITRVFPDGTSHRILKLDISDGTSSRGPFYVNMNNGTVESEERGQLQRQSAPQCNAPQPARGATAINVGTPGRARVIISQDGHELWKMDVTRPSSSSGISGSGIDLKNVKYKGKTVLQQAHVPILNVEYVNPGSSGCGPHYRDWQNAEYPLHCNDSGTDTPKGFRLCKSAAKTIVDEPHIDGGNYKGGVAVYVDGLEVVMKSQMEAGWYRYTSEWRFHVDGTLRPRFGFGAVYEGAHCVCQVHIHHAYWRFDFDIDTQNNNIVREFNQPPIHGTSNYHDIKYEVSRLRDPSHQRHWEISNNRTGHTWAILPGTKDGTADEYGVADVWVLKHNPGEIDDGVTFSGTSASATIERIDKFLTGEVVKDADVVVWYAGHFTHDQVGEPDTSHIVGPNIVPIR